VNPLVFDRLGTEAGGREIKYLVLLPLTADIPLLSPEYGQE
jgi:hypothetical protein